MERPLLTVRFREKTGKGVAKKMRAKGAIPAIFYGPRTETIPITVDPKELAKTLQTEAGGNVLIDLDIQKDDHRDRKVAMVKDIQYDVFQKGYLHADFYEVAMDEEVTVEVPIILVGKAEGVKLGGILDQIRRVVQIQCLPADIPKRIDVDVSSLMIGDSIHVNDLQVEKGKILSDTNYTIASVVPPLAEEKPKEEVVAEAAAEGEVKEKEEEGEEKKKEEKKKEEK
jgi:large subunit ribosomal protein L25